MPDVVTPLSETLVDRLRVLVFANRADAGAAAGEAAATCLAAALGAHGTAGAIFAAAPSQDELLAHLAGCGDIGWPGVTAFQMDEYLGLADSAPQRFSRYLAAHLFDAVAPGRVEVMRGAEPDGVECERYAALLAAVPIDLVCLGIGENGHLAFNDPGTDFSDPRPVAQVRLTLESREQQVHDGGFARLEDVPISALTLTIPALLRGRELHCVVPGARKRAAVSAALRGEITPACPASILRTHPHATLYLDLDSQPWSAV